jgi:hypothetical protein
MIYLYRFELLSYDAAASDSTRFPLAGTRRLVLATNYEAPVLFPSLQLPLFGQNGPFPPVMLPSLSTGEATPIDWVFEPTEIEHSALRLDSEQASGQVDLKLPLSHEVAALFANDTPSQEIWLSIATIDSPTDNTPTVEWFGKVASCTFDEYRASLKCSHISEVLNRPGLTRKHPRTCGHVLFDRSSCGVVRHQAGQVAGRLYFLYRRDCLITAISEDRLTVTLSEFNASSGVQPGWFVNGQLIVEPKYSQQAGDIGFMPWSSLNSPTDSTFRLSTIPQGGTARTIAEQDEVAGTVSLIARLPLNVEVGNKVTLYAGCDKTQETCKNKFSNARNFGGYKFIPIKNPFTEGV